jgi:Carboxypeptidase regulatory-like domain
MRWRGFATAALAVATCALIARPVDAAARRASATPTHVVGTVVDREGHGVAGARVMARPTSGERPATDTVTDAAGRFRFVGLPPGDYWFVGIHGGYPIGATPSMPVSDRLEVSIALWGDITPI